MSVPSTFGALVVVAGGALMVSAAPSADLVTDLPGYTVPSTFKVYSGYLEVPGPFEQTEYDSLSIHYQFHTSSGDPSTAPVATWHQGGPGGSSLYGAFTEMGYFQVDSNGTHTNPYAWNQVANMLYLESPAGSDDPIGFSYCTKGGQKSPSCSWNDTSQAEAYAHTLLAFYKAFPEFSKNPLYLTGESYAGQYLPNIAYWITSRMASSFPQFTGIAVGNGCWGGDETNTDCNGPNSEQNDIDMYFGKGLVAKPLYNEIYSTCKFPRTGPLCDALLEQASRQVGPHNVYDIYDNCPNTREWIERSGKSMRTLKRVLRENMHDPSRARSILLGLSGGYDWSCGGMDALRSYFSRAEVQKALHLGEPVEGTFRYRSSGPASVTLYPKLVKKIRVLIYNGDADACVPYKGNEEWTEGLATSGAVDKLTPWHPWFSDAVKSTPAGYATTYSVPEAKTDFSFITIRLAGHMVPTFRPEAAFTFFKRFLAATPF